MDYFNIFERKLVLLVQAERKKARRITQALEIARGLTWI